MSRGSQCAIVIRAYNQSSIPAELNRTLLFLKVISLKRTHGRASEYRASYMHVIQLIFSFLVRKIIRVFDYQLTHSFACVSSAIVFTFLRKHVGVRKRQRTRRGRKARRALVRRDRPIDRVRVEQQNRAIGDR